MEKYREKKERGKGARRDRRVKREKETRGDEDTEVDGVEDDRCIDGLRFRKKRGF